MAETQYSNKIGKDGYYILGIDVGRFGDQTEVAVIKVSTLNSGNLLKQLVNILLGSMKILKYLTFLL